MSETEAKIDPPAAPAVKVRLTRKGLPDRRTVQGRINVAKARARKAEMLAAKTPKLPPPEVKAPQVDELPEEDPFSDSDAESEEEYELRVESESESGDESEDEKPRKANKVKKAKKLPKVAKASSADKKAQKLEVQVARLGGILEQIQQQWKEKKRARKPAAKEPKPGKDEKAKHPLEDNLRHKMMQSMLR